ncbi:leucine carboxyl partial [Nannochloropsis oceanica]
MRQVQSFLEGAKKGGKRRKVVVLGGGMDGLLIALCANNMASNKMVSLLEIDVPEVVTRKEAALRAWMERGKEGGKEDLVGAFMRESGKYALKVADLRDLESLNKALEKVEIEEEKEGEEEMLFILEAVLGYLQPNEVERLLRFLSTTSFSCSLLVVDTGRVAGLAGKDAVAAGVKAAFAKRGSPIEGLEGWQSRRDVQGALRAWGWRGRMTVQTLWEATNGRRGGGRKGGRAGGREGEVEEEAFDEYAAWHLFAHQSWCIHASSSPCASSKLPSVSCSPSLSIRPYRPQTTDHASVAALIEEGREDAKVGRPGVASFVARALSKDMKLLEKRRYAGRFWIAEEKGQGEEGGVVVVGCVGLRVSTKKEGGREGEVVRLSVGKEWRGRGVGLRLLKYVEKVAQTWVDGAEEVGAEGGGGGRGGGEEEGRQEEENGDRHAKGKLRVSAAGRGVGEKGGEIDVGEGVSKEGQSGLRRLRATTLGEEALPGALALYVDRAGWVMERQSTYGGGKGGQEGEGILYHLYKDI